MTKSEKSFIFEAFDYITIKSEKEKRTLPRGEGAIAMEDVCVELEAADGHTDIYLIADTTPVEWVKLRWNCPLPKQARVLGMEVIIGIMLTATALRRRFYRIRIMC